MSEALSPLDLHLAAFSPLELADLDDTVRILLKTADDGTDGFATARRTVYATLRFAISRRIETEHGAKQTAAIIPFRRQV